MNDAITIPEPCQQDWDAMLPERNGRYCGQCCQTVVDFTGWQAGAIAAYLFEQRHQPVCGRFRKEQLESIVIEPGKYLLDLHRSGLSYLKKVAAVFLFVFCLSEGAGARQQQTQAPPARETLAGKPVRTGRGEVKPQQPAAARPAKRPDQVIMGGISMPAAKDTSQKAKSGVNTPIRKKS